MSIQPFILGHGRAGQAIAESLAILRVLSPELGLLESRWFERDAPLRPSERAEHSLLLIANPPGLHAEKIIEANANGFHAIACEKPACVSLKEIENLRPIQSKTAIFHGYRQMWGPQMLKEMLNAGEFGELISIEGRYWQSSAAERALHPSAASSSSWKNEIRLSGEFDTLLDIGTHWMDLATYLVGQMPEKLSGFASHINADRPHRDSHIWVQMKYPLGPRSFASVSKTVHGATNHFEICLLGAKKSATWTFLNPDEIHIGEGRDRRVLTRKTLALGSKHTPFHAMGWTEGYIEIIRQLLLDVLNPQNSNQKNYPTLQDSLDLLEIILQTKPEPL